MSTPAPHSYTTLTLCHCAHNSETLLLSQRQREQFTLVPLTLIRSGMSCQQPRRASLSPSGGSLGSCSILQCQLPTAQPRCIMCCADEVSYLLNIPLSLTAKANTVALLIGFSQSRVYIKSFLILHQCCPICSKSSRKFG